MLLLVVAIGVKLLLFFVVKVDDLPKFKAVSNKLFYCTFVGGGIKMLFLL